MKEMQPETENEDTNTERKEKIKDIILKGIDAEKEMDIDID